MQGANASGTGSAISNVVFVFHCVICVVRSGNAECGKPSDDEGGARTSSKQCGRKIPELPRWRAAKDVQTVQYCLWRRRAYIHSGRLMANKKAWNNAMAEAGKLTAEDMWQATASLGKNAGFKELLSGKEVPENVKRVVRHLLVCMGNVVGSNAHRTLLRHINRSYCIAFGPPLVFTTPNVADVAHLVVRLMHDGASVMEWKLVEEHDPDMPSKAEMLRRVAADPVTHALFFDMMIKLFLTHVLGVDTSGGRKCPDGVASEYGRGIFGVVQAFLGPIETQGRGGLHTHMHVWILHALTALVLDRLRRGELDEELAAKLAGWRSAVMEKVASVQFDSVEEIGRQLGLDKGVVKPVPFQKWQQQKSFMDGQVEEDDATALPPKANAPNVSWAKDPSERAQRRRPLVEVADDPELDPHDYVGRDRSSGKLLDRKVARALPMKGACLSLCPQWRRKPRYRTLGNGRAVMCHGEIGALGCAAKWKRAFALDSRLNMVRNHIHKCKATCYKRAGDAEKRACRFNFNHEFFVCIFGRRAPRRKCTREKCPCKGDLVFDNKLSKKVPVHPHRCPPRAMVGRVLAKLRNGKALNLPRARVPLPDGQFSYCKLMECPPDSDWAEDAYDYAATMDLDDRFMKYGRVLVLRYNPHVSSSNPVGQCLLRCNWDVQCMDRVFELPPDWWKQVNKETECHHGGAWRSVCIGRHCAASLVCCAGAPVETIIEQASPAAAGTFSSSFSCCGRDMSHVMRAALSVPFFLQVTRRMEWKMQHPLTRGH